MNYGQPFYMTVAAVSLYLAPMRGAASSGCSEVLGSQPKVLRLGEGCSKLKMIMTPISVILWVKLAFVGALKKILLLQIMIFSKVWLHQNHLVFNQNAAYWIPSQNQNLWW